MGYVMCLTICLFEKRIGQVTMDFLCIRFAYLIKDNQQECSGLSNWFSLRCLGMWMDHLPPAWWPIFRLCFWERICVFKLVEKNFPLVSFLYPCFYVTHVLAIIFLSNDFILKQLFDFQYFVPSCSIDAISPPYMIIIFILIHENTCMHMYTLRLCKRQWDG